MTLNIVFVVMLTGHVLGDFYFQTEKMVKDRQKSIKAVFQHGAVYAFGMLIVFLIGIPITQNSIKLFGYVAFAHLIIDILKYLCTKHNTTMSWLKKHIFIVDQCAHFGTLALCWLYFGRTLCVNWYISQEIIYLPHLPIIMLLGVLCILRPVNIFIQNTELWNNRPTTQSVADEVKSAGKVIGYLERLIIFIFLLYGQFSAMAFVLTAKSIARFKDIEQNKSMAEYYLIGTLLSVTCTLVITIVLGLCIST